MSKDPSGHWKEYWDNYAKAFAYPLTANGLVGKFVANPAVTGAYAEAWIRSMAASMLPRYRISSGAVLRPSDPRGGLRRVPQCDLIIWDPSELPALFEQGDFALVPWWSVRALVEIKRSIGNTNQIRKQLGRLRERLLQEYRRNVLGVVVSHRSPLFEGEVNERWLSDPRWNDELPVIRLLSQNPLEVDTDGVLAFVYFLAQIAQLGSRGAPTTH
jgi:hypothetical protein